MVEMDFPGLQMMIVSAKDVLIGHGVHLLVDVDTWKTKIEDRRQVDRRRGAKAAIDHSEADTTEGSENSSSPASFYAACRCDEPNAPSKRDLTGSAHLRDPAEQESPFPKSA